METQSVLYYDQCTKNLYFDEDLQVVNKDNDDFNFPILLLYLLGFYHLSWFIIDKSRQFSYDDILIRLNDSRTILRLMNNTLDIFDEHSLNTMNTTELLEQTLKHFSDEEEDSNSEDEDEEDSRSEDEETIVDSESESECHESIVDDEKEAAEILTSMGKNWVFNN